MKLRKYLDISLVVLAAVLLAVGAFFVKPWVSADSVALIRPAHADGAITGADASKGGCSSCNNRVLRRLGFNPGVAWVRKDVENDLVVVAFDSNTVRPDSITAELAASGYAGSLAGVIGIRQYCGRTCNISGGTPGTHSCGRGCRHSDSKEMN